MCLVKEKIVNKAMELYIKRGVKSVTMDQVASFTGVSKRTIYENFKDKQDLVQNVADMYVADYLMEEKRNISEAENVIHEIFISLDYMRKRVKSDQNFLFDIAKFFPEIHERNMVSRQHEGEYKMRQRINNGIKQGFFIADVDIDLVVMVFTTTMRRFDLNFFDINKNISPIEFFSYITIYFFRGISTEKGIAEIDRFIKNK